MFDNLSAQLGKTFDGLRRRGALTEKDLDTALREVRIALLEADVALDVVKKFIRSIKKDALGQSIIKSVSPTQMVIKIVHDNLVELLGHESTDLELAAVPPVPIMLIGLQGSGKTTTTAKIASRLINRNKKQVLMASLDVHRPAAQEQLKTLGENNGIETLPIIQGQTAIDIAQRAMDSAKLRGIDVVLLDTAGRLTIDEGMMAEAMGIKSAISPTEILLVADSLTGQDAVNTANAFNERLKITGIVLTRVDGDARGGAALSMRSVTGCPIKLLGTGEKIDSIEPFYPDRIASRILGMGDMVTLVEKAKETVETEEAKKLEAKIRAGGFDLDDYAEQLRQMQKMGGMTGVMGMLPGVGRVKKQLNEANIDEKILSHQQAIISSMTKEERCKVKIINGSRRRRIAAGAGTSIQEVNRLLKQHRQMADMIKKMGKLGKKGISRTGNFGFPGLLQ